MTLLIWKSIIVSLKVPAGGERKRGKLKEFKKRQLIEWLLIKVWIQLKNATNMVENPEISDMTIPLPLLSLKR